MFFSSIRLVNRSIRQPINSSTQMNINALMSSTRLIEEDELHQRRTYGKPITKMKKEEKKRLTVDDHRRENHSKFINMCFYSLVC